MSDIKSFVDKNVDFRRDDPFFVFNVQDVLQKHQKWLELLPRVKPYYAVKANRFPVLLDIMVELGLGFDCASKFEIEEILKRGGQAHEIIFAHPRKSETELKYSRRNKVDLMTFDNEEELVRINAVFPEAQLVLRIKVTDKDSIERLGSKFGADMQNVEKLLIRAKNLNLSVMGIAFHVGSICHSAQAFEEAIKDSRTAFDMAKGMGFAMSLLDIGGGFPGSEKSYFNLTTKYMPKFEEFAQVINNALSICYPEQGLKIIGEPGRYYSESAFSLFTKIISKSTIEVNNEKTVMYYLNDGIYGSFPYVERGKMYNPVPFLKNQLNPRTFHSSILWGPTLDGRDCIRSNIKMPEMTINEWILFEDMGSYTQSYYEFGFNGVPSPSVKVFVSELAQSHLKKRGILTNTMSKDLRQDKLKTHNRYDGEFSDLKNNFIN